MVEVVGLREVEGAESSRCRWEKDPKRGDMKGEAIRVLDVLAFLLFKSSFIFKARLRDVVASVPDLGLRTTFIWPVVDSSFFTVTETSFKGLSR